MKHVNSATLAALLFALAACKDASSIVQKPATPTQNSITPRATFVLRGDTALVTVVLDVTGDVGRIGSFTGRLKFDHAAMTYVSESPISDGTLRASNRGTDEVRVAGASSTGIDRAALASFRFAVRDTLALHTLRFDLEELHELARTDMRASVQRGTAQRSVR